MSRFLLKRLALIGFLFLSATNSAGETEHRLSGIFSNLRYSDESGDLIGWEILVVPRDGRNYTAIIQLAEGGEPSVATGMLVADGENVVITVPGGHLLAGRYKGVITATELRLETPTGSEILKRGNSYWQ